MRSDTIAIGEQEQLLLLLAFHLTNCEICTLSYGAQSSLQVLLGTLRIHYSISQRLLWRRRGWISTLLRTLWPAPLIA
jgi:hypothetical protein